MKRRHALLCLVMPLGVFLADNRCFAGSSLTAGAIAGYYFANVYGQGSVPSYSGILYGADAEFVWWADGIGIAPFISFRMGSLENSANSVSQSETMNVKLYSAGLRISPGWMFIEGAYVYMDINDEATGSVTNTLDIKSSAFQFAAGVSFSVIPWTKVSLSGQVLYSKWGPESGALTERRDFVGYGVGILFHFIIPSGGKPDAQEQGGRAAAFHGYQ